MGKRWQFPQPKLTDNQARGAQPVQAVGAHADRTYRRSSHRALYRQGGVWFLVGIVVLGIITLLTLLRGGNVGPGRVPVTQLSPIAALTATGTFREFPLPRPDSEVMRPTIDHQGRVWFGAMGQNALVVFDPSTQTFQY